jgi:hypothetical protein
MSRNDGPEPHEPAVAVRQTDTLTLIYLQLPATFVWATARGSEHEQELFNALVTLGLIPESKA